jgi:hypothetical protein
MARKVAGEELTPGGGETDLKRMLAALAPAVDARRFSFVLAGGSHLDTNAFAMIREDEATTLVRVDPQGEWARITLKIHSSLSSVGLTAAITAALADRDIPANVIAASFHDHLFVPWSKRDEALGALHALSRGHD